MNEDALPWQSLGHLLREQAERYGDRKLFRFESVRATFAQIEERTNRLANVLSAHGVHKGTKIALMMPNGIEFPTAWLAIAKLGAVTVPVNIKYSRY